MKFKVGDQVILKKVADYPGNVACPELMDKVLIVQKIHYTRSDNENVGIYFEKYPSWYMNERFELVDNEKHFQDLIKLANEGQKAIDELVKTDRLQVSSINNTIPQDCCSGGHSGYTYYLKPLKPKEKKFFLGDYEVVITKDLVQIGCQKDFQFKQLQDHLISLTSSSCRAIGDWEPKRTGIYHNKANGSLTWEQVDFLLAELNFFNS